MDLYEAIRKIEKICRNDPELWNLLAYELQWIQNPKSMNFLDRDSPNHWLKILETEIYMDVISRHLRNLRKGAKVLDAGGGIGRFSIPLSRMGFDVTLVDYSERSLEEALKHARREKRRIKTVFADLRCLPFDSGEFDALIAIESICYSTSPERVLRELTRVLRRDGLMIISVEGKYGGMIANRSVGVEDLPKVLSVEKFTAPADVHVEYFTEDKLRDFLEKQGLSVVEICGSHYIPDGIFHHILDEGRLHDGNYRRKVRKLEEILRRDEVIGKLARAWIAIARKR